MRLSAIVVIVGSIVVGLASFNAIGPFQLVKEWRVTYKTKLKRPIDKLEYEIYNYSVDQSPFISIDFLKGEHFWHPQLAFWIETTDGDYIMTLLVTTSTAKGIFFGGRTAENFKDFDNSKSQTSGDIRRVNALPYWAFKRNILAIDGLVVPHPYDPLPDGITGATPSNNFVFTTGNFTINSLDSFIVKMEINVAFDQNESYSEYDYLEDDAYHSGTGLLGQPSLVYASVVNRSDSNTYYLMKLEGHGHHSGQNGDLYKDLSGISTASKIVERVLVKVNW